MSVPPTPPPSINNSPIPSSVFSHSSSSPTSLTSQIHFSPSQSSQQIPQTPQEEDWLMQLTKLINTISQKSLPSLLTLINKDNLLILSMYYYLIITNTDVNKVKYYSLLKKTIDKILSLISSSPLTLQPVNQDNINLINVNEAYNSLTEDSKNMVRKMFSQHFGDERITFPTLADYARFNRLAVSFTYLDFYHTGGVDDIHPILINYDQTEEKYFKALLIFVHNLAAARPCLETTSYILPYIKSVYKNKYGEDV
jgi:hypothetical protein